MRYCKVNFTIYLDLEDIYDSLSDEDAKKEIINGFESCYDDTNGVDLITESFSFLTKDEYMDYRVANYIEKNGDEIEKDAKTMKKDEVTKKHCDKFHLENANCHIKIKQQLEVEIHKNYLDFPGEGPEDESEEGLSRED